MTRNQTNTLFAMSHEELPLQTLHKANIEESSMGQQNMYIVAEMFREFKSSTLKDTLQMENGNSIELVIQANPN